MTSSTNKESPNSNHETALALVTTDTRNFYGYSELSVKILEDFLRPKNSTEWHFKENSPMWKLIQLEHLAFEQRCFRYASHFIKNYTGGQWIHSPSGVYCIVAEPTERFHFVNAMNWSDEQCNPLEVSFAITLIALDQGMNSENDDFANAMIYFRSTLMQIIEEQYEAGGTLINTSKIIRMID